jgi:hypothetical protein
MAGCWKLKFTSYFMEATHEPLHWDKRSLVLWNIMDIPTSFIWIIIFFDQVFEYGALFLAIYQLEHCSKSPLRYFLSLLLLSI